jgi:hypothetical protein
MKYTTEGFNRFSGCLFYFILFVRFVKTAGYQWFLGVFS